VAAICAGLVATAFALANTTTLKATTAAKLMISFWVMFIFILPVGLINLLQQLGGNIGCNSRQLHRVPSRLSAL
jgi:hypothetical protein